MLTKGKRPAIWHLRDFEMHRFPVGSLRIDGSQNPDQLLLSTELTWCDLLSGGTPLEPKHSKRFIWNFRGAHTCETWVLRWPANKSSRSLQKLRCYKFTMELSRQKMQIWIERKLWWPNPFGPNSSQDLKTFKRVYFLVDPLKKWVDQASDKIVLDASENGDQSVRWFYMT